jgi:uncharacterized membrane protein
MSSLTVWRFGSTDGAQHALRVLGDQDGRQLLAALDAALVTWEIGQSKPRIRELRAARQHGALGGGFWGLLFGLIFFVPMLGLAIGAAAGALIATMANVGISDSFIREVREKVTPGTSALFLLSPEAVLDIVADGLAGAGADVQPVRTNLSREQEEKLRAAFCEDD